jgi:hypothetical protein
MSQAATLLLPTLFGFACGYAVRELISQRQRAAWRKRNEAQGIFPTE